MPLTVTCTAAVEPFAYVLYGAGHDNIPLAAHAQASKSICMHAQRHTSITFPSSVCPIYSYFWY